MKIKCNTCQDIITVELDMVYQCSCRALLLTCLGKPFGGASMPMYSVGCDLDKSWSIFSDRDEEFVDAKYHPEANTLSTEKPFGVQEPDRVFAIPKNSKLKLMGDVIMLTDATKWSTVQAFVDENTNFVYGVGKAF